MRVEARRRRSRSRLSVGGQCLEDLWPSLGSDVHSLGSQAGLRQLLARCRLARGRRCCPWSGLHPSSVSGAVCKADNSVSTYHRSRNQRIWSTHQIVPWRPSSRPGKAPAGVGDVHSMRGAQQTAAIEETTGEECEQLATMRG